MLMQKSLVPSRKSLVPSKGSINQYASQFLRTEKGIFFDSSDNIGTPGVIFFNVSVMRLCEILSAYVRGVLSDLTIKSMLS